jgi:hypothetical protein
MLELSDRFTAVYSFNTSLIINEYTRKADIAALYKMQSHL